MSTFFQHEITGGVLLSRLGNVHKRAGQRIAQCGQSIPDRHAPVSHTQAVVHKLPLCGLCYPAHNMRGGRSVH